MKLEPCQIFILSVHNDFFVPFPLPPHWASHGRKHRLLFLVCSFGTSIFFSMRGAGLVWVEPRGALSLPPTVAVLQLLENLRRDVSSALEG